MNVIEIFMRYAVNKGVIQPIEMIVGETGVHSPNISGFPVHILPDLNLNLHYGIYTVDLALQGFVRS